jgi:PAS domain S-box-containing protein
MNERSALVIEVAAMGVWEWDPNTKTSTWNDRMFDIYGIPKKDSVPFEIWSTGIHPEDLARVTNAIQEVMSQKTRDSFEFRIIRQDGITRHVYAAGGVVVDDQQNVVRLTGVFLDITERKQTEEKLLRESERKTKRLLDQQIAINRLALTLGETLDCDTIYTTIYKYVRELTDAWVFIVLSYDDQDRLLRPEYYISGEEKLDAGKLPLVPLRKSRKDILSRAIYSGEPQYSPDLLKDIDTRQTHYRIEKDGSFGEITSLEDVRKAGSQSALYVPMKIKGKVSGVMQLQSTRENAYTPEDIDLMAALANVAAVAIENARLYEEVQQELVERKQAEVAIQRRAEELDALQETVLDITRPHKLTDLLQAIVERAAQLLDAEGGGLYLCDEERKEVRCVVSYNTPSDYTGTVLKYGEGLAGKVSQSGEPIMVDNYSVWAGRAKVFEKEQPFKSTIGAPMIWQGKVTGVIDVLRFKDNQPFSKSDLDLLLSFADHAAIACENARALEAEHAALTEAEKEIAARKRTEEALQAQRDFSYQVMNTLGQGIAVTDENEHFEYVNPKYAEMTGYQPKKLIGKSPKDFTSPDEHALLFRETARRQAGESSSYEIRLRNRHGQQMFILVTAVPRWIEGVNKGAIAVITDLTERKHAEEALKHERDRAQLYLDIASVILLAHDARGNVVMANRKACDVLGYEEQEVLGKNWAENFVPKRMRKKVSHVFEMLMEGNVEGGEFNENPILTRKGEERLVSWHNTVIRDETGQIIGHLGSGEDITERKRAEEALVSSEIKYRSLAENAGVGIATIDSDGKLIYTNSKLCDMIGYPEEELVGKSFVDFIHPDDLAGIFKSFQKAGLNPDTETQIEYRIIRKDGKAIICFSTPKFFWEKGLVGGFSAIIQDITERKRAEDKAKREAARVAALARVAARMNAQLDLQTVLNIICEETATALRFPACSINLLNETGDYIYYAAGYGMPPAYGEQRRPVPRKLLDDYIHEGWDLFVFPDIQAVSDLPITDLLKIFDFRTVGAVKLERDNRIMGMLIVNTFGQLREISEDDKAMLHNLGNLAVQAIVNARLYEDVRHQATELARSNELVAALARVSAELQSTLDTEQVISVMGKELKILGIASFLTTLDSEENALIMQGASIGEKTLARIERLLKIKVRGLTFRRELLPNEFDNLISDKRPVFSPNIMEEACKLVPYIPRPLIVRALSFFEGSGSRGVYLPLISSDRVFGVLGLHSPDLRESDVATFSVFANNISAALENARLYQAVQSELEERKRTEAALQEAEERYRTLVEQIPAVAYTDSAEEMGKTLYINPQLKKIAGYDPEQWVKDSDLWMKIMHSEDRDRVLETYVRTYQAGEPFNMEYRIISPEGRTIWFHDEATLICDRSGRPLFWQGIMLNVTNQKQAEDALRKALAEKEVLLREVHHRVKNNLQAIIYLIEGRIGQVTDQQMVSLLKGLQEQARTMALVYEQLYQSDSLAEVKMKHYLQMLADSIREAFSGERLIEVSVESEDINLDIGTAMPCGLMVTELLTNSLKHAFPPDFERNPRVEIILGFRNDYYDLVVRDNGVSLPQDLDKRAKGSMGLKLVRMWATHQMGGTFEIESGEGATFHVTFPKRIG